MRTSYQFMWAPAGKGRAGVPALPAGRLLEDGLELELAADRTVVLHHLEAGHRLRGGVALLVEAELAVETLVVLEPGHGLADSLPLPRQVGGLLDLRGRPLDAVDGDPGRLRGVERVAGRLLGELLLVVLVGLGADALHLLEGQAGERH